MKAKRQSEAEKWQKREAEGWEEIREVQCGVDERPGTFGTSVIPPRYNGKRREQ